MKAQDFSFEKITKSIYFKIAIVAIVIIIVFAIVRMLPKSDDYTRDAANSYNKNELSYTDLEYKNFAERLFDAMSGAGTDEEVIYSILKRLNNKSDWNKLIEVFGVRETNAWYSDFEGNLMEWLVDELDSSEQDEVRTILGRIGVQF
jgi:hypothetical protein